MSPPSYLDLGIPPSDCCVSVRCYDIVEDAAACLVPAPSFMKPVPEGCQNMPAPAFAFCIDNVTTGQRVVFDLGPRKDIENAAPPIVAANKAGLISMPVKEDICEQLVRDGVDLNTVSCAIWSHAHFDHTGDMSLFPASTKVVYGGDTDTSLGDVNPESQLVASDLAGRESVALNFDESKLTIGGLRALDFFGDGSLYLLDVPGHIKGHLCGLARVTPTSFVYLGGDACHHPGMMRPTEALHRHFPCPGHLLAATRTSVSAAYFSTTDVSSTADASSASAPGEFNLLACTSPLLDVAEGGFYDDPPAARRSIAKMGDFDANNDVLVVLAHDWTLSGCMGPLPADLNDWQEKGWKERTIWDFLKEENPSFRFNDKKSHKEASA
ncbi:hypothetical protein C8R46DRAFT_1214296 [Mycena filopes]|nr:hypothetical protein C8R46DRAFT_1214296 [Mycena filopes]